MNAFPKLLNYVTFSLAIYPSHSVEEKTDYQYSYNAYGVGCTEVEIDVLTGELQILRVDILYDCGDRYTLTRMLISFISTCYFPAAVSTLTLMWARLKVHLPWVSATGLQRSSYLTRIRGNCSHTTHGYIINF